MILFKTGVLTSQKNLEMITFINLAHESCSWHVPDDDLLMNLTEILLVSILHRSTYRNCFTQKNCNCDSEYRLNTHTWVLPEPQSFIFSWNQEKIQKLIDGTQSCRNCWCQDEQGREETRWERERWWWRWWWGWGEDYFNPVWGSGETLAPVQILWWEDEASYLLLPKWWHQHRGRQVMEKLINNQ